MLTNRIGGLAQQAGLFELLCFIDNHDTDTQVCVWCGVTGVALAELSWLIFGAWLCCCRFSCLLWCCGAGCSWWVGAISAAVRWKLEGIVSFYP